MERVITSYLNDHVIFNGLENVNLPAYKLGHSSETTLTRGKAISTVLFDQSAAFDTMDHGTLRDCLSSWFGISGLDWFKSFLSNLPSVH